MFKRPFVWLAAASVVLAAILYFQNRGGETEVKPFAGVSDESQSAERDPRSTLESASSEGERDRAVQVFVCKRGKELSFGW